MYLDFNTRLFEAALFLFRNTDCCVHNFQVFATASYDDHKNIVLLAFEIIEKILRDYFPYITETESSTFTDCVNCLIAFTNSRFNKDISLNAIGFLRFCAAKLAEGDIGSSSRLKESPSSNSNASSLHLTKDGKQEDKDDNIHFWFPLLAGSYVSPWLKVAFLLLSIELFFLVIMYGTNFSNLAGLSELTFDLRPEIRKSSLQVLFDTLRNHGHLFSLPLWEKVFDSVLFPIFDYVRHAIDPSGGSSQGQNAESDPAELDQDAWMYETCTLALQLVVDLFVKFYDTVNPLLKKVLSLLTSFIKRPHQSLAGIGIAAFVRLMSSAGSVFVDEKWLEVVLSLKEVTTETLPDFSYISSGAYLENVSIENGDSSDNREDEPRPSEDGTDETSRSRNLYFAIADAKCRAAVQLLLIQVCNISSYFYFCMSLEAYCFHHPSVFPGFLKSGATTYNNNNIKAFFTSKLG
jgi:brefeldin A-inhibited guanine nucleotide-exchange protein